MDKISGGKYMCLTLLAVVGFCLEFVLAFVLEPMIWGVSLADYSTSQYIIHWTITCVVWGIVGFGLMITAKKNISMTY